MNTTMKITLAILLLGITINCQNSTQLIGLSDQAFNLEVAPPKGNVENCQDYTSYGSCSQCEDNYYLSNGEHTECKQCQEKSFLSVMTMLKRK
jgi:hypothetical protein